MIGAESRGTLTAEREEAHLKDFSIGLTQTLTATAFDLAARAPGELGLKAITRLKPMPQGGDLAEWQAILRQPFYAIRLGALYFDIANKQYDIQFDPVLCYAAYNAGSPRENLENPWGLHYYRKKLPDGRWADAMDNFSRWYGDAVHVYGECA
jgi:soluble lytic murein transglycosylase-like protein